MSILIAVLIFVRCCEKYMCSGQESAMMCDLFSIAESLSLRQTHLLLTRISVIPLVKETALVLLQCTPPELLDGSKRLSAKVIISKLLQTLTFYVTSNITRHVTRHTSHVTHKVARTSNATRHTSHGTSQISRMRGVASVMSCHVWRHDGARVMGAIALQCRYRSDACIFSCSG
jgi:hypothetical protein